MKKIKPHHNQRLLQHKAYRRRKCKIRRKILCGKYNRLPHEYREIFAIRCPKRLSLKNNYKETLSFFDSIRRLSLIGYNVSKERGSFKQQYSIKLDSVEFISVRCAVIFAAELDRLQRTCGGKLKYSGSPESETDAISMLRNIGCFKLIGFPENTETNENLGHRTLIPLISGRNCESVKFNHFETSLKKICNIYRTTSNIHEGMAEAMLNVVHHAYITEMKLIYPSPGNRWWAAACYDSNAELIRIFIFDQGHGIPQTLPVSGFGEMISKGMDLVPFGHKSSDATLLKAALEYARSRTKDSERGKGFRDITRVVENSVDCQLVIASGKAEMTVNGKGDITCSSLSSHIGGTLIEWVFPTDNFDQKRSAKND